MRSGSAADMTNHCSAIDRVDAQLTNAADKENRQVRWRDNNSTNTSSTHACALFSSAS